MCLSTGCYALKTNTVKTIINCILLRTHQSCISVVDFTSISLAIVSLCVQWVSMDGPSCIWLQQTYISCSVAHAISRLVCLSQLAPLCMMSQA